MPPLIEVLREAEILLKEHGIDSARLDAELLLAHALGCKRSAIHLRRWEGIGVSEQSEFWELILRRCLREPLQYIVGRTEFYGLDIMVGNGVIVPRHETEELVEKIILRCKNRSIETILDLGTGSGAIGLALAKNFPLANVLLVDESGEALAVASKNLSANSLYNVSLLRSNWLGNVRGSFDIITANPPYLSALELESASAEVRNFEPKSALVADCDGLGDIFEIIGSVGKFLANGALLALEIGSSQRGKIHDFAKKYFSCLEFENDLCGRTRFAFLQSPLDLGGYARNP
ncbi:MAG: peptide chain release factor N(5)-glutamine methyltransferase [Puniceicoccales bacterium]|nr:peptide chain release factor N(5)-glutamine methyltransferase [Puniceicoccales bacterium]